MKKYVDKGKRPLVFQVEDIVEIHTTNLEEVQYQEGSKGFDYQV